MKRYTVLRIPDTQVGGYSVKVPTWPGGRTERDTLDEALENAKDAIALYLEDLAANGEPIPEELAQPFLMTVEVA